MAFRAVLITVFGFAAIVPSFAQGGQSNSQTLEAILSEVKAIREEMKITESTQILLTELEIQQAVVNRAMQRVDDAESKLRELKVGQKYAAEELAHAKESLDQATDPGQKKQIAEKIENLNTNAATLENAELERSANLQTAQQKLKDAQDALDDIENQLTSIVKRLKPNQNQ